MTAIWTPIIDDVFYAANKPRTRHVESMEGTITVVPCLDRSYHSNIFRCTGSDDTAVIGVVVHGPTLNGPHMFLRSEVNMMPVGPDVVAALSLAPVVAEKDIW